MEYFFDGASAYKWQHPCVASISCEINTADQDEFENTKVQPWLSVYYHTPAVILLPLYPTFLFNFVPPQLWVIMAIVAAIAVVFALICFCIVYAFKHCGSSGGKARASMIRD